MLRLTLSLLSAAVVVFVDAQANTITGIPSQSSATPTYSAPPEVALSSVSYSYAYTVTTPTTAWRAPTFATASPPPACSDSICSSTSADGKCCADSQGVLYGILCNTQLSGVVITTSGRLREKEKRSLTGSFAGCTGFCDAYNETYCTGVTYAYGECLAYDSITGTFNAPGGFAALRQ